MLHAHAQAVRLLLTFTLLYACAFGASTTVVQVTAITTVTAVASGSESNACQNFYGACVVYGGWGSAAYTTTVYAGGASTTITSDQTTTASPVTSTATVVQTTTASDSGACDNYDGACVVYGSSGVATTTVYSSSSTQAKGSGDGEIGESGDDASEGAIGGAAVVGMWTTSSLIGLVVMIAGFAFWL